MNIIVAHLRRSSQPSASTLASASSPVFEPSIHGSMLLEPQREALADVVFSYELGISCHVQVLSRPNNFVV